MPHPNMKPVFISSGEVIEALAREMKTACLRNPSEQPHAYSSSEEEAIERSRGAAKEIEASGLVRILLFPDRTIVTVVLTLDSYCSPNRWNLSMSRPGMTKPLAVRDEIAKVIVDGFLGEGYQEIAPEGAFKQVRQFLKEIANT